MSMSTYCIGIKPVNESYHKMLKVYNSCIEAGIEVPEKVEKYFNFEKPDIKGVHVDIKEFTEEYNDECENGIEVDITKLPKDIKIIRFLNSY